MDEGRIGCTLLYLSFLGSPAAAVFPHSSSSPCHGSSFCPMTSAPGLRSHHFIPLSLQPWMVVMTSCFCEHLGCLTCPLVVSQIFHHLCNQFPILNSLSVLKCLKCFLLSWLNPQLYIWFSPFFVQHHILRSVSVLICICSSLTAE